MLPFGMPSSCHLNFILSGISFGVPSWVPSGKKICSWRYLLHNQTFRSFKAASISTSTRDMRWSDMMRTMKPIELSAGVMQRHKRHKRHKRYLSPCVELIFQTHSSCPWHPLAIHFTQPEGGSTWLLLVAFKSFSIDCSTATDCNTALPCCLRHVDCLNWAVNGLDDRGLDCHAERVGHLRSRTKHIKHIICVHISSYSYIQIHLSVYPPIHPSIHLCN